MSYSKIDASCFRIMEILCRENILEQRFLDFIGFNTIIIMLNYNIGMYILRFRITRRIDNII